MPPVPALIMAGQCPLLSQVANLQPGCPAHCAYWCVCSTWEGNRFLTNVSAAALEAERYPGSKDHKVSLQNEGRNKHVTGAEGGRQMNPVMSYLAVLGCPHCSSAFRTCRQEGVSLHSPLQPRFEKSHSHTLCNSYPLIQGRCHKMQLCFVQCLKQSYFIFTRSECCRNGCAARLADAYQKSLISIVKSMQRTEITLALNQVIVALGLSWYSYVLL